MSQTGFRSTGFRSSLAAVVLLAAAAVLACFSGCGPRTTAPVSTPPPREEVEALKPVIDRPGMRVVKMFREWDVADTAADALARIGDAAAPTLIEGLADPNPIVRAQVARALARMGPKAQSAVPALIVALEDEDVAVRLNAARALGQIGVEAQEAVPALMRALKDPANQVPMEPESTEPVPQ
ncbi:MAG TPA: HEAT repeat domain-containing protein [Pirellulales bacterium]|nr:HEAT repeat domain-containing protein [Pirellulales bacterium]